MTTIKGCLRSLGCYDSTSETREKCSEISRPIMLAIVLVSTLAAFSYAIFLAVQCKNDTDEMECQLDLIK